MRAILRMAPLLAMFLASGCRGERATEENCREIVDRIVYLEMTEMGYRDAKLVTAKQAELRAKLAQELASCPGRHLPAQAMACVRAATSTEALSHGCFR